MRSGRPLSPLTVSAEQREQLQGWSLRAKTAQALALRSRIVLLAADGLPNKEIARRQGCSQPTGISGGSASWTSALTVCWMSRALARHAS